MGTMRIMGSDGDTKLIWDSTKKDEVDSAKKTFKDLTGKGYKAFAVKKSGAQGEMVDEFDPDMEKIILVPQIRGG